MSDHDSPPISPGYESNDEIHAHQEQHSAVIHDSPPASPTQNISYEAEEPNYNSPPISPDNNDTYHEPAEQYQPSEEPGSRPISPHSDAEGAAPEEVESDQEPTQEEDREGEERTQPLTRIQLSDDSDEETAHNESVNDSTDKPAEVDELMNNIFGEDSDDDANEERTHLPVESEDEEKEWDFDRIMEEKKRERSKKRKRRKDGSIDLCSDADGQIRHVVELMKNAAHEDREANNQRRPAIKKTQMLEVVRSILLKADWLEALIENDMMSAISEWLAPLPDKSLPALEIRTTLLKILSSFSHIEPGVLKQSGLGKAVMLIFKHPKETRENKIIASKLIRNWSQPIFQISADYASVSRDEREAYDFDRLPEVKRRKLEEQRIRGRDAGPSRHSKPEEPVLGPGDPGFIGRARVPKLSTSAYIIRPKPNIEGNFQGATKNRQNSRFDRAQRDFKERTKTTKASRAVGVSLEGRRMD